MDRDGAARQAQRFSGSGESGGGAGLGEDGDGGGACLRRVRGCPPARDTRQVETGRRRRQERRGYEVPEGGVSRLETHGRRVRTRAEVRRRLHGLRVCARPRHARRPRQRELQGGDDDGDEAKQPGAAGHQGQCYSGRSVTDKVAATAPASTAERGITGGGSAAGRTATRAQPTRARQAYTARTDRNVPAPRRSVAPGCSRSPT